METHVMRRLCANVFICPTCLHMIRNTPLEDRKFTILLEGNLSFQHIIPLESELWSSVAILEKLEKLLEETEEQPFLYLDRKIPASALAACTFLTDPISICNN